MSLRPPRHAPDDELRLIVLDCLRHLSPCTDLQLLQFMAEYNLMNYFEMMFSLNDLCSRGQAVRTKRRAGYLYEPTEAGHEALTLFGNRVPNSVKALLAQQGPAWRARFLEEAQYQQQITQQERGEIELTLSVVEQEMDMMRLSLSLPSREMANALAAQWPKKAAEIYETVIRLLSEDLS